MICNNVSRKHPFGGAFFVIMPLGFLMLNYFEIYKSCFYM